MKENYTQLYPNAQVAKAVGDYSHAHSSPLSSHITAHHAWGVESQERSNYMISPLQAQFQIWFAKALGTKRVLEIGTFIGFSTMGWSEAVGADGHVTALEFDPGYAKIASETFERNGIKNIDVVIGDAQDSILSLSKGLKEPYDLVFVDADKTSYPRYLELILELSKEGEGVRLLRKGGVIAADNILTKGLVADSSDANPVAAKFQDEEGKERLRVMDAFNKEMVKSDRLDVFLMPMFDGLGLGRLVD